MKKISKLFATAMTTIMLLAACGGAGAENISVISREDGSGTRGAFIELFGIEEKDATGEKVDNTTVDAEITNSTSVMMTNVAGNTAAIGYISLGSLNDTVQAVAIDGADATVANIKNNTYKIARPFNIATNGTDSDATKDFIGYILSTDGQAIVEENKYISVDAAPFTTTAVTGKVTVVGSSSVAPLMEKLIEGYAKVNPNVTVEMQQNDSTTGMNAVVDGTADIGMASRAVKDSETAKGVQPVVIAMDGIAVIVNNASEVTELTSEQVKAIFVGDAITWAELQA